MNASQKRMTSDSLVVGMRAGDEDAWTRMTGLFGPHVYKSIVMLSRHQLQPADMADISQEVFFTATQKIETYRHSREKHGSFRGWLYGITRNKVLQFIDAQAKSPSLSEYLDGIAQWSPETLADDFDGDGNVWELKPGNASQAAKRIRANSEDHTWQAFWRTTINGERACDVAEDLGMTAQTIRQAAYRTAKRLIKEIKKMDDAKQNPPATTG